MKQNIFNFIKQHKIQLGILLFFLIYMLFFDEYNWLRIREDRQKLKGLKEERSYLEDKISSDRQQLKALQTDPEELEKFAREKYLLKKSNEEVYIIQEKNE